MCTSTKQLHQLCGGQDLTPAHVVLLLPVCLEAISHPFLLYMPLAYLETWSSKIKAREAATLHLQGTLKFCASVLGKTASCQLYNHSKTQ